MTKQEIAENYINGNHGEVKKALCGKEDEGAMGADAMTVIGRAMDVKEFIRGWYGSNKALEFTNWLQKYSDL